VAVLTSLPSLDLGPAQDLPSLVHLLRRRAALDGARDAFTFLTDGEQAAERLRFADLDLRARAIGAELQKRGAAGARCLLLYPPGLDYVAAFFGTLYAGAIAVPVYPPDPARLERTLPRLLTIARDAQATELLTTAPVASLLQELRDDAPDLARMRWLATDVIDDSAAQAWSEPPSTCDAVAMLQYTSGSTSQPRGVILSHGNLLENLELMQRTTDLGERDAQVSWLPLYHDMGLIGGMLFPVFIGIHATLLSPVDFLQRPVRWLQAVSRTRATLSGGPNFAYDLCVRKVSPEERGQLDLSHWRYAFNGAEPVREETLERFARFFEPCGFRRSALRPLYGLAEATLMAAGAGAGAPITTASFDASALAERRAEPAQPGRPSRTLVGCGQGLPEQQLAIVDPASLAPCPPGRIGEIWLQGPSISRGYWGWAPAENQPVFAARMAGESHGAFLRTGDLGFLHRGELFVAGRLKDVLLVRGRSLYPQDLERTIESSHPSFRPGCCAAFSVEQEGEEQVVAVQEVSSAHAGPLEVVVRQAMRSMAREHGVQLHQLVPIKQGSILKTSSGKVQRFACRAAYLAGSLDVLGEVRPSPPPPRAVPPERHFLLDEISRLSAIPLDRIDLDATVLDVGLDSLQLAELKQVYQARAGAPIEAGDLLRRPLRELLARAPAIAVTPVSRPAFTVEWDLAQAAPAVLEALCRNEPWLLQRLQDLRDAIPIPSTNGTFDEPDRFRPAGHFRAFYLRGPGESVVAVKGADLRCEDQTGFLQVLHQRPFERFARHSVTNVLEYFLIQERKVPGALLLNEGLAEARAAGRVQAAFLERYGALGDLPVPLLVIRWSDEVVARFCDRLFPLLSGTCLGIARDEIARGLGCYIYYFPKPPFPRVSHFAGTLAAESHRTGASGVVNTRLVHATLAHNFDPGTVVDSWIRLVARMLLLGFFPADAKHFKNGQSIEPQNVLLNGSFADLDSVTSMEGLDDRDFYCNLLCVLNLLTNTIRVFLTAENNGTTAVPAAFPQQFPKPDFLEIVILVHLWERLKVHAAEARAGLTEPPDPRLEEILGSGMSFPVLFDKILYAIYYQGPRIPESALHLVGITDVYSELAPEEKRPTHRLQYDARIQVDAAALATIPRSFLDRLEISALEFVRSFMKNDAALVDIYDTFLGRIGLVVIPVEDAAIYVDADRTLAAVERGMELAARQGAAVISLTGLIPSATDYGRRVAQHLERRSGPPLPPFTTGHATTIACFAMAVEKALASAGRSWRDEDVALLGLGSIGGGVLELLLRQMPHPRSLRLVDLAARRNHLQQVAARISGALGFRGELTTIELSGQAVTRDVYDASLIVSATSVPDVVEVEELRPGTIVVDDSAPHCLDPRRAIRRFQQRRDLLLSEAGAIRSHRVIGEISDTAFSTGWDHKVRAALKVVHPNEHTLMGCVFSSLLSARFPELGCLIGTPEEGAVSAHYLKLKELGFEGSHLYFQDHVLDPSLVDMFRAAFSGPVRSGTHARR